MGTAKPPKSRQSKTERPEPESASEQAPPPDDGAQDATGPDAKSAGSGKPLKKKFKYTRQLVRIAHDEGMTQTEIGKLCRVQQSVVSKWMKGESRGTEQQLAPLLKRFGARLNRTTSRVYLTVQNPDVRWEDTEFGKHLLQLAEQEASAKPRTDSFVQYDPGVSPAIRAAWARLMPLEEWRVVGLKDVIRTYRALLYGLLPSRVTQVEGPIIFRYSFCRLESRLDRRGIEVGRVPMVRWALHDAMHGKFVLVRQYRRALLGEHRRSWDEHLEQMRRSVEHLRERLRISSEAVSNIVASPWLESSDDAARWICRIEQAMSVEALLKYVDEFIADEEQIHSPHDVLSLPFLLRKALVEHGYSVPGVEKISYGE